MGDGIYRTTISIRRELKERMDAARPSVNWSAVAAAAFEAKLDEIDSRRKAGTMEEVINRLRASRKRSDAERQRQGRECGEAWAKQDAEAEELEALEAYPEEAGTRDAPGPADLVCQLVGGEDETADDCWRRLVGTDDGPRLMKSAAFVDAFVEAALEVWREVEPKL